MNRETRLPYLLTKGCKVSAWSHPDKQFVDSELSELESMTIVNCDDASAMIFREWKSELHIEDFPNIAPMFSSFALNYIIENDEYLVIVKSWKSAEIRELSDRVPLTCRLPRTGIVEMHPTTFKSIADLVASNPSSEWIMDFSWWHKDHRLQHILRSPASSTVVVAKNGSILGWNYDVFRYAIKHVPDKSTAAFLAAYETFNDVVFAVSAYSLCFMHCHGVTIDDAEKQFQPTFGKKYRGERPPKLKYKILNVTGAIRHAMRNEPPPVPGEPVVPLHLCRGHFRTYRPEESTGLFGRGQFGTFWIPDHRKGKIEKGVVVKDYKLKPGDDGAT